MLTEENFIPYTTSPIPPGPYLIFAPHPDDETFGMGGTIALAASKGIEITVVVVSDGSAGGDPEKRKSEAQKAASILGIKDLIFWGIEDRHIDKSNLFEREIPKLIEAIGPKTVFIPSILEFHPDHRATASLVWQSLRGLDYQGQIWLYEISRQAEVNHLIDITPVIDLKRQAIRAYQNQLSQRPYEDIVLSLNRARCYTLPKGIDYSEGFWALERDRDLYSIQAQVRHYLKGIPEITELPLVSIIIRTKDRPRLLKEALESVASQTYPNIEAVVVNDGGCDVSEIVDSFRGRIYQVRHIAHPENRGRAAAANTGLGAARGEWIGLLDDDDLLISEALQWLLEPKSMAVGAVYGMVEVVEPDQDGILKRLGVLGRNFSREALFIENYIPTCGLFFRRHLALKLKGFDETFDLLEDWDFIYRLAQETNFLFIRKKVARYRTFGQSFILKRDYKREGPWREKFYQKHLPNLGLESFSRAIFFYVEELKETLSREHQRLEEKLEREQAEHQKVRETLSREHQRLEEKLEREQAEHQKVKETLSLVTASKAWRVTAPLRWVGTKTKEVRDFFRHYGILGRKFLIYSRIFGIKSAITKALTWRHFHKALWGKYSYKALPLPKATELLKSLKYQPLISVVIPVYNTPVSYLYACLESVFSQYYSNWELCIADDASSDPQIRRVLEEFRQRSPEKVKIIYRRENGRISATSNSALSLATGEFVAFLDHDDELTPDALLEVAKLISEHPEADMIYSDEDKIAPDGSYVEPFFKPDWSPEQFMCQMYTCHLGVYRRSLLELIGGFRQGFEGSQDYDLVLRLTEKTNKIFHIPKILYHWRIHSGSTAGSPTAKDYANSAALKALQDALARRGEKGWVEKVPKYPGSYLVHYSLDREPLISIIIPTRDLAKDLSLCLSSIYKKSKYSRFEIIVVDNGSQEEETFEVFRQFEELLGKERFRVFRCEIPFNFSRLVNIGAEQSRGELLLLLNNDTELIGPANWMEEMAGYAVRREIGCVGAILSYPNNTIQHAGVILGVSGDEGPGVAGHIFLGLPTDSPGYFARLKVVSNYASVTGACLMVKRELWDSVGGFDEEIAIAFNDVDFCLKLLDRGYRHVVLPHVHLYHYESKSRGYEDTPEKQARFRREVEVMRARWGHILDHDPYYNPNLTWGRKDPL